MYHPRHSPASGTLPRPPNPIDSTLKMSASSSPPPASLADSLPLSLHPRGILTTAHTHSPPPRRAPPCASAWGFLPPGKGARRDTFLAPHVPGRISSRGLLQYLGHPSAQKWSTVSGLASPADLFWASKKPGHQPSTKLGTEYRIPRSSQLPAKGRW